jgi:hypothetical protein
VLPAFLSLALSRLLSAGPFSADMHGTSGVAPSAASSMDVCSTQGDAGPQGADLLLPPSVSLLHRAAALPQGHVRWCARMKGGWAVVSSRMDPVLCQDCPPVLASRLLPYKQAHRIEGEPGRLRSSSSSSSSGRTLLSQGPGGGDEIASRCWYERKLPSDGGGDTRASTEHERQLTDLLLCLDGQDGALDEGKKPLLFSRTEDPRTHVSFCASFRSNAISAGRPARAASRADPELLLLLLLLPPWPRSGWFGCYRRVISAWFLFVVVVDVGKWVETSNPIPLYALMCL